MPEDRRLTIGSTARMGAEEVARRTFATARRGFDPGEVRGFLEAVARELQAAAGRERELLDALTAAEHRATNPVLDEATLTAALGQETAKVLRSAHDAGAELLAKADADSTRIRAEANEEADQLRARAEQHAAERAAQAEAGVADLRRSVQEETQARLETAKLEAEALLSQTRAECRAMVHEAQELRARVLSDLTRRRRVLHSQIEQLRAGRERLAETIGEVRHTVDRVTDELFRAEDEARLAAEAAGRQAVAQDEDGLVPGVDVMATAPSPADGSATTVASEPNASEEAKRKQAVEELFARLRAERTEGAGAGEGVTLLPPLSVEDTEERSAVRALVPPPSTALAVAEPEVGRGERDGPADEATVALIERRTALLAPALSGLSRRLKRALQDDQNDILDRLRAKGDWGPNVLPDEAEHEQRYVRAAVQHLDEAARAGAEFAGSAPGDATAVGDIGVELASAIVAPLRRRLDDDRAQSHAGDEAALVEHVGAAFREWKGQRVERLATDYGHAAFTRAVLHSVVPGTAVRWIVDDDGAECPDCDDNALAGSLPRGEPFPTGHAHPPAHPGCRCLLVPEAT